MAVMHRAYTFDPVAFHQMLQRDILHEGTVRDDCLLAVARMAVSEASPTTRQALEMVRFDAEWLDPPDGEIWPTQVLHCPVDAYALGSCAARFTLSALVLDSRDRAEAPVPSGQLLPLSG